jgi:tRNA(fMet)-specific endonuclease VapC
MSLFILDTDTLQLFQDNHGPVVERVAPLRPSDLAITIISVEEQLSGWYTQLRKAKDNIHLQWAYRRLANNIRFLARIQIFEFDKHAIDRYEILKKLKLKIGKMDLRIAAIVSVQSATLVTRNARDFRIVPGLKIEDWSK